MKKIENKSKKSIIIIIVFILSITLCTMIITKKNKIYVKLTQITNSSPSQMMGYVIKTSENKTIVIDGGAYEDTQNLTTCIEKNGNNVDAWFVTHPHKDHVGALTEIIKKNNINIQNIYITLNDEEWYKKYGGNRANEAIEFIETLKNKNVEGKVHEVAENQKLYIGKLKCEILGIKNPEIHENAINNSSMVIKFTVNKKGIIFLGDTGKQSGEKLLHNQKRNLKADILQIAHHGQQGADEELYKEISPTIALWPTPKWLWDNDNGNGEDSGTWKTKETRKWIENLNIKENIVEKDGNITIEID